VPKKPLIACVDDDVSAREALEGFLKAFGFAPEIFSSAEEFLQSERLNETSCLITDLHLGGMSGLQLQSRLAASAPAFRHCYYGISRRPGSCASTERRRGLLSQ